MSEGPLLFDAVLFDLDGTLVATDTFWVAAARAGARRAFAELGLARELPSAEAWLSMVGLPIARGFEAVFPDLDAAQRARVMERCLEEEDRALRAGQAALMPHARECLVRLRELGAKLGLASNCSAGYLQSMLDKLGLGDLVDESRCLDTPGMHTKTEMLADLVATFGARSAVMVGDRAGDADAAHARGLPHVHLAAGLAPKGECIESEAVARDLFELVPLLLGRTRRIEDVLARLRVLDPAARVRSIGITGHTAAGKSLLARDLARVSAARGRPAAVLALDEFRAPADGAAPAVDGSPLERAARAFDLARLIEGVLLPHRRGEVVHAGSLPTPIPPEALLVLEGPFLLHPQVRMALDRVVFLDAPESAILQRVAARAGDADSLVRLRREDLPAQRAFDEAFDPRTRADLVLEAGNPLADAAGDPARGGG